MEGPAHQGFSVEDIPTKSVAFHPTLASITHEFPVRVQPGAFAITINKIDHQVDPESIRVESLGPARVIDIQHANVLRYSSTCKPISDRRVFDPVRDPDNRKDTIYKPYEGLYAGCGILKGYSRNDSLSRERQPMGYDGAGAQDTYRGEYGPALYEGANPSMLEEQNQRPASEKPALDHYCQVVVHVEGQVTAPAPTSSPGTLPGDKENQAGGKTQSNEVMLHLIYTVPAKSELKLHDLNINTLFSTAKMKLCALFTNMSSETWRDAQEELGTSMYHDFYPPDSKVPESISQGHGLSVSYELPGRRVIKPSSAPRRYE
ncbi:similar to An04g08160 [Aspergillus luchuensis IFO 4308]|nr:similar to An04g08160 [Aspergillus luchuensis IFO 4308]